MKCVGANVWCHSVIAQRSGTAKECKHSYCFIARPSMVHCLTSFVLIQTTLRKCCTVNITQTWHSAMPILHYHLSLNKNSEIDSCSVSFFLTWLWWLRPCPSPQSLVDQEQPQHHLSHQILQPRGAEGWSGERRGGEGGRGRGEGIRGKGRWEGRKGDGKRQEGG